MNTAVQAFRAESGAYPTAIGDWFHLARERPDVDAHSGYDAHRRDRPHGGGLPVVG